MFKKGQKAIVKREEYSLNNIPIGSIVTIIEDDDNPYVEFEGKRTFLSLDGVTNHYVGCSRTLELIDISADDLEQVSGIKINSRAIDGITDNGIEIEIKTQEAKRYNSNKAEFFDAPLIALAEVAKVAAYGRSKYDQYNWKKPAKASQYIDCRLRHSLKYMYGQDLDSESHCHHLAHLAWNALAELEKILTGTQKDDRYKGYPKDFVDNIESLFMLNEDQKEAIKKNQDERKVNNDIRRNRE